MNRTMIPGGRVGKDIYYYSTSLSILGGFISLNILPLAGYRYIGEVEVGRQQGTAHTPRLTADSGDILKHLIDIAGDHGVLDPADDSAVFYLVAEQDIAAEITAEDIALGGPH